MLLLIGDIDNWKGFVVRVTGLSLALLMRKSL